MTAQGQLESCCHWDLYEVHLNGIMIHRIDRELSLPVVGQFVPVSKLGWELAPSTLSPTSQFGGEVPLTEGSGTLGEEFDTDGTEALSAAQKYQIHH